MGTGPRVSLAARFLLKTPCQLSRPTVLNPNPERLSYFFPFKNPCRFFASADDRFYRRIFFVIIFQTTFADDSRRRISRPLSRRFCKILKFRAITYSTPGLILITADKKIKNQHFLQVSEASASFINEPADFDLQTM